jgi:hypothetical protein
MSNITRRVFISSATLLAVGLTFDAVSAPRGPKGKQHFSVEDTKKDADHYWRQKGYTKIAAASIISGIDYNGGLNYDESISNNDPDQSKFVFQPSSRVEDIANKLKPGTLPIFTTLGFSWPLDSDITDVTTLVFDYLINYVRLDPSKLRVTTTALAEPLFTLFDSYGVSLSQIRVRSLKEAMAAGDGSGWFAPEGHPDAPAFATYSVEYVLSQTKEKQKKGDVASTIYEIELAEIGLNNDFAFLAGAIGVERVTMARNDKAMYWDDYLPVFRHAVLAEAQREQKQLPLGYYEILGLQPNND